MAESSAITIPQKARHALLVRATHWLTVAASLALLITGGEIVVSHPRFYLGETGNMNVKPLFQLPIPSSREKVVTGYNYVLPDQNGWSRALHFEAAWILVLTGLIYCGWSLFGGHLRRNLVPAKGERNLCALGHVLAHYLKRAPLAKDSRYNALQQVTYLAVIFVLFPLMIWTGLDLSPAFSGVCPWAVIAMGGRQTARTLHFFFSLTLVLFVVVHVAMVVRSGFRSKMRCMILGRETEDEG